MFSEYKVFPKSKFIRVQEFSSKDMYSEYRKFPQKRMYSKYKSFPRKKMYSPKRTWLRYRVWRWRLFSSGWKEAVNLRLNHSICWKILKIFRKIWKCKYKYKYDWRNRSLRAVWKSSHILSTRGTFGRPLNWTWRLKILKTIWWTLRQNNKRI